MKKQTITVSNAQGLHMRPAGVFAKEMSKFQSEVSILHNENTINGKSIMNLIGACIKFGAEITICCDGEDEVEALEKAVELFDAGLGE